MVKMPMDERAYMTKEEAKKEQGKKKREVPYRALKVFWCRDRKGFKAVHSTK